MAIILYFSPYCTWSDKCRVWMKAQELEFEERDVMEPTLRSNRDEILEKSGQLATPVLDVHGEIIVGFYPEKIAAAAKSA